MPKRRLLTFLSSALILIGLAMAYLGLQRQVTLVVDGSPQVLTSRALTVTGVLREAGYTLTADDRVFPGPGSLLLTRSTVRLDRARRVELLTRDGKTIPLQSAEAIPANLLILAGVRLYPGDALRLNGEQIDPYQPLPAGASVFRMEYKQALPLTVQDGASQWTLYSSAGTLIEALWQAGITLSLADRIQPDPSTSLTGNLSVAIERAQPAQIVLADRTVNTVTTADTVGELLVEAGIPLQGLDYALPAEDQALPEDRQVRLVRVHDEILLEQQPIPFSSSYIADDQTELDQRSVVTAGEYGIQVSRVRVRLEDGVETARTADAAWVAKEPVNQVLGYGTQAVVKNIDTPYGTLEYWRAVNVYATSYSPCRLGIPNYCNYQTSSGAQLRQGIVAVTRAWYSWMRGQQVYIPGYGIAVVGDVGGGIPGRYWVDLGYSDEDFKSWASNVTMYFLTPVPAAVPGILP